MFRSALAVLLVVSFGAGCPTPAHRRAARPQPETARPTDSNLAVQAEFDRAFASFADQQWAEAAAAFGAFLAAHPGSALVPEARYRRGVAFNRLQRFEDARTVLRDFLEQHPTSAYARQASVELGLAETKLGNKEDAAQILAPVLDELTPEERKEVEPALTEAIKEGTAGMEALRRAADATRFGGPDAMTAYVKAIEEAEFIDLARTFAELREDHPAWPALAAKMARVYYHLGDFERARDVAQKALPRVPAALQAKTSEVLARIELRRTVRPNVVGAILPVSGRFRNFGAAVEDGIKLALPRKDGIELVVKDSQGDPELAVAHVEALAKEGAIVILGPVGVAEAAPAAVRAQELGIPMILLSRAEGVTAIGDFIFRNSLTNSAQGRALARYATEVLGAKQAAVLGPDLPSSEELAFPFWDTLEAAGGELRGYETYAHDQTSFAAPIKRLVARNNAMERTDSDEYKRILATEKNPYRRKKLLEALASKALPIVDFDVLLVPDYYRMVALLAPALAVEDIITTGCDEKEMERIRKTTRRDDLKTVTLLGGAGWNSPELVSRGGRYVQCSVFVDGFYADSAREPTRAFVEAFQEQFERKPGLLEAQAYDSARIVRQLIRDQRPATRADLRDLLANVKRFPGATGATTFGPDREADKPLFFLSVEKNGIVELDVNLSPAGIAAPRAQNP